MDLRLATLKQSLSICCTMFQHWINAERFPVSHLCVNTLPASWQIGHNAAGKYFEKAIQDLHPYSQTVHSHGFHCVLLTLQALQPCSHTGHIRPRGARDAALPLSICKDFLTFLFRRWFVVTAVACISTVQCSDHWLTQQHHASHCRTAHSQKLHAATVYRKVQAELGWAHINP